MDPQSRDGKGVTAVIEEQISWIVGPRQTRVSGKAVEAAMSRVAQLGTTAQPGEPQRLDLSDIESTAELFKYSVDSLCGNLTPLSLTPNPDETSAMYDISSSNCRSDPTLKVKKCASPLRFVPMPPQHRHHSRSSTSQRRPSPKPPWPSTKFPRADLHLFSHICFPNTHFRHPSNSIPPLGSGSSVGSEFVHRPRVVEPNVWSFD